MRFFGTTKINFLGQWKVCTIISILLISTGIISLVVKGGPAYNIDFAGGTLVQVRYVKQVSINEVRALMKNIGYGDAIIQQFGSPNEILIRVSAQKEAGTEEESISDKIIRSLKPKEELLAEKAGKIDLNNADKAKLQDFFNKILASGGDNTAKVDASSLADEIINERKRLGGIFTDISQATSLPGMAGEILKKNRDKIYLGSFIIERVEMVGPKVGKDLRGKALFAINCAIIALLIYITFRFELVFALGAVIALIHDVMITLGVFSLFDKEISLQIIAAFLTVAGYSINDTIVIFDRAKENFVKSRTKLNILDFDNRSCFDTFNLSVNQTLGRTVLTSGTTLLVTLSLFLFGGAVIHDFAFALLIGVLTGTYSSIYVASTIVYGINFIGRRRKGFIDTPAGTVKAPPKPKTRKTIKKEEKAIAEITTGSKKIETKAVAPEKKTIAPTLNSQTIPSRKKTRGKSRAKKRDKAKGKAKKKK